jgi:hypothetical protein
MIGVSELENARKIMKSKPIINLLFVRTLKMPSALVGLEAVRDDLAFQF